MNLSDPFIRRPVATTLLAAGIVLLGFTAYRQLPIASLPTVDRPTISVNASLPGASADVVATAIAAPLESQLGIIPGIAEMASFSGQGGAQIVIQFDLNVSIDAAAGAVQAAINAAAPDLPQNMPQPPYYYKANPSGAPVIVIAMTSDTLPPGEVYNYADTVVAEKLSQIEGVARVITGGADRPAVRVQADPRKLATMSLSLERVRLAIQHSSLNLPKGTISAGDRTYTIGTNDQLFKADEYRRVVIGWRNGAPVHLEDVADVSDGVLSSRVAGWYNDRNAVVLQVFRQPDANVVETVDRVLAVLPQLSHWIPPSIEVQAAFDRTLLIRASIADVRLTIGIAAVLVVLVIALFLRRFWATVIPSVTIPVSLAGTAVVMYACGYSLDNLSLMALTIAVGFVIDDAVIMIENIMRLIDEGNSPVQAAFKGAKQMGFTVVSITAALISALIPILFMPDIVGRYFREFGVTLVSAIVLSAVVSLTLTPMMCRHLLTRVRPMPTGHLDAAIERAVARLVGAYGRSLDWSLRHSAMMAMLIAAIAAGSAGLYVVLPKGFMPTQDTGIIFIRTITNSSISFTAMTDLQRSVSMAIRADPAVANAVSFINGATGGVVSNGIMLVSLKPLEERRQSIQEVIERLRAKFTSINDVRVFFFPVHDLNVGAQASAARYQYTLIATDPEEVARWGEVMRRKIVALSSQVQDVITDAEAAGLEAGLIIDRQRAAYYGVTPVAIDNTLYDAFGQRWVNLIFLPLNWSQVILEADPSLQADPSFLSQMFVSSVGSVPVPLAAFTRPRRVHAAMWMHHNDRFPSITISFDVKPGIAIREVIGAIRSAEVEAQLPDDVKAYFRGEAAEASKSSQKEALLFLGAVLAVYVVLGVLYESYAHPFTILSILPSTSFGALVALYLTGSQFTLMTSIACILLVGMVMKNAIMMVDFALEAESGRGLSPEASIREAATLRFRPILMTTLAAILSAVPLAIGTGAGHELRQPLGIAIVGGLLLSQILTLYTTPAVYLLIDRLRGRRDRIGSQFHSGR